MKVAIIGAGVSGLACARALSAGGCEPVLFEKAQGPWGRLATRRLEAGGSGWDYGAQYFTARTPGFEAVVRSLAQEGVVSPWEGTVAALDAEGRARPAGGNTRWVGVPGMSALGLALGRGLEIRTGVHVARIDREADGFTVVDTAEEKLGAFDAVVLALPSPQAAALVEGCAPLFAAALAEVRMEPCWAGLAELEERLAVPWDGAFTEAASEVLGWVARDSSKPGRPDGQRWVLHARSDWSAAHLEESAETVAPRLAEAFRHLVGGRVAMRVHAHRWRYARGCATREGNLSGDDGRLVACGDWAAGGRVEGAFLSGTEAARFVLDSARGRTG